MYQVERKVGFNLFSIIVITVASADVGKAKTVESTMFLKT